MSQLVSTDSIQRIRQKAYQLGFDSIGFTQNFAPKYKSYFLQWLEDGKNAEMSWLAKNKDKRLSPDRIFEQTKSVIVLASSYFHHESENKEFKIAKYAHGDDYHHWIKERLESLAIYIKNNLQSDFSWRSFVDTGPVLERDLAVKAGIGWVGKNSCLINEDLGSFIFLSVLFCNLELPVSRPSLDQCGSCTLCLDACPTNALTAYQLDARRCLAFHNIEKRGERDQKYWEAMGEQLVGCDICQDVCPWNQKANETQNRTWLESFANYDINELKDFLNLNKTQYKTRFSRSALSRIKFEDFMRNVFLVIGNLKKKDLLENVLAWKKKNSELNFAEFEYCVDRLR